jgi:inhibitor of cysteine peptidase
LPCDRAVLASALSQDTWFCGRQAYAWATERECLTGLTGAMDSPLLGDVLKASASTKGNGLTMNRLLAVAAVVGLGLLFAGCSQGTSSSRDAGRVELGAADNGKKVQVAPDTVVQITLDSNVTTGYSWKLAPLESRVVEKTKQEYIAPDSQRAGAGGEEVWTFTTRAAGETPLRLEYVRPWEKDVAPAKTFEVTVVVK